MSTPNYTNDEILSYCEKIYSEKVKGNEFFRKAENEDAISHYKAAIDIGESYFSHIPEETKKTLKDNAFYDKFISELKNSYSNLAAVYLRQNKLEEIIKTDKYIISNLDGFFDKSYARIIMTYWNLKDTDNATNYYMMMLKKFNRETIKKYEEQLKPVEEKSKELLEKMRKDFTAKNKPSGLISSPFAYYKIIGFFVIMIGYLISRGFFKNLFGGNRDNDVVNKSSLTPDLDSNIPLKRSDTIESIDMENIKDEDLAIDTAEDTPMQDGLNDKNSL